jgi:hypothetical protein
MSYSDSVRGHYNSLLYGGPKALKRSKPPKHSTRPQWELDGLMRIELETRIEYRRKEDNRLHRTDGPAIEHEDGTKKWCSDNYLHREDGPAVEYAGGSKEWYREGKRHREDGPALEHADGTKVWALNGISLSEAEWRDKIGK